MKRLAGNPDPVSLTNLKLEQVAAAVMLLQNTVGGKGFGLGI